MRKLTMILLAAVLALGLAAPVAAADASSGGCRRGWELHPYMPDHDEHHAGHLHVGPPNPDRNGDGQVCVKHVVTPVGEVHIHIDNRR